MEPLEEPDDSEYEDATRCETALHGPVGEPAAEPEDLGRGDTPLYRQLFTDLL